jgi:hypothetical protein
MTPFSPGRSIARIAAFWLVSSERGTNGGTGFNFSHGSRDYVNRRKDMQLRDCHGTS